MVYIPGGDRIGKTQIGFEFCHIDLALVQMRPSFQELHDPHEQALLSRAIERRAHHIFLELTGEDAYCPPLDSSANAALRLGVRLAARSIFRVRFTTLVDACDGEFGYLDAHQVLHRLAGSLLDDLPKEEIVVVVVQFDDFHWYVDALVRGGKPYEVAIADFKEMMNELGSFMRNGLRDTSYFGRFVLLPIATGSFAADVHYQPAENENNNRILRLRPLGHCDNKTEEYAMMMADAHYAKEPSWPTIRTQPGFRIALADCGGIPGYVNFLLSIALRENAQWGNSLFARLTFNDPRNAI